MTAENVAYIRHLAVCKAAAHGQWCRQCIALVKDADAESWQKRA